MAIKVLVVDDEPELLQVTLFRLNKMGYEALGAGDGQEALELARQKKPHLIVLDVHLPSMDGDEVAAVLKKDETLKCIPVILISAVTQTLDEKVRRTGAVGGLCKPFEPEQLISMIKKYANVPPASTSA